MSDTLANALSQASRSSSVLEGIANPPILNPLAAQGSALDMASKYAGFQGAVANIAAGQALQQATDENGNVDYQKAQSILARDPRAPAGMRATLLDTSRLRGEQLTQTGSLYNMIGAASASLMNDPSDANIDNVKAGLVASGAPPGALAELDRIKSIQDPDQRRTIAYQHNLSAMDAQHRLAVGGYPTPTMTQMPQGQVAISVTPPSPYRPASVSTAGGVGATLSPDQAAQPTTWKDSRNNPRQGTLGDYLLELQRGNVTGPAYNPSGQPIMLPPSGGGAGSGPTSSTAPPPPPANATIRSPGAYTPAAPAAPGVPAAPPGGNPATSGTPGGPGTYQGSGFGVLPSTPGPQSSLDGGGVQVASADPSFAPTVGAAAPPSPAVAGNVNAILAGMNQRRGVPSGGTQEAFNALQSGGVPGTAPAPMPPPAAPPSQQPAPPAAQPAAPPGGSGVVVAPSGAHYIPGPSPGTQQEQEASANQYAADRAEAGNFQARIWPMVQARSILQKNPDLTTGIGAQAVNTVKSGLQTLTSIFTPADIQTIGQAKFDELGKYFQQAVNANPFASGSDQRLASAISGSPNTHLSTLANKEIVDAMIGLERMKQAAFTDFQNSGQPGSEWGNFKAKWQTAHDPRAFVADMLDDTHLRNMLTKMSPSELTAYQNTLTLLKANPSILNTAPMPQKQSFLSLPPRSQPNALLAA